MNTSQKLSLAVGAIDSIIREATRLKNHLFEIADQLGLPDLEDVKEDELDKEEDEEEGDYSGTEDGWIIVDPNPPRCKGTDHYYTDDDDSEHDDGDWSPGSEDAIIFPTEALAKSRLRMLKMKKNCHFRSTKAKNLKVKKVSV